MSQDSVFLAVPTYDNGVQMRTAMALMAATRQRLLHVAFFGSSLLAHGFNRLWVMGLEQGASHWAMIHADVGAAAGWLDLMLDDLEATGADLLSAVVPIKNKPHTYSTALGHVGQPPHYQLRKDHLDKLPPIFDGAQLREVSGESGELCVNTGLWVCRLDAPWVRKVSFNIKTWIDYDGPKPVCRCIPEDWGFSQQLHALGLRVLATTKVPLVHVGQSEWAMAGSNGKQG